jgi:hypothetical protein
VVRSSNCLEGQNLDKWSSHIFLSILSYVMTFFSLWSDAHKLLFHIFSPVYRYHFTYQLFHNVGKLSPYSLHEHWSLGIGEYIV